MRSFERAQALVGGSTGPNSKVGIGVNLGLRVWGVLEPLVGEFALQEPESPTFGL